jgi:osmoprotectant transport system permease protein
VNALQSGWNWLMSGQQWHGANDIPARLLQHLGYAGISFLIAALIAVPIGMLVGHTGRGAFAVTSLAIFGRALPTLGLVILAFILSNGSSAAALVPLIVLAIPPILVNTYEGIRGVDPAAKDAAAGMGMSWSQSLLRVEAPAALPLIVLGLRTGAIQVVSTATIASVIGLGGLGRFIIDGLANDDYAVVAGGAMVVVLLALAVQLLFTVVGRLIVPAGLRKAAN